MNTLRKKAFILGVAILITLWTGCGGQESNVSAILEETLDASDSPDSLDELDLSGITEIDFIDNQAMVQSGPDGKAVVALYSTSTSPSENPAYHMGDSVLPRQSLKDLEPEKEVHEILRDQEFGIQGEKAYPSTTKALVKTQMGGSRSFKVLEDLSGQSAAIVEASLRYSSGNIDVYVDDRNSGALSDSELETVLFDFDSVIQKERNLFGAESDVNGDGKFVVLMSQAVNELGSVGGGMLTGFFYAVDLYSADYFPVSNEMEILYTMVPDSEGAFGTAVSKEFALSNILPSVLPHEFQHMINYNQHVFVAKGFAEDSFLNEALSHLAEDIYSIDDGMMRKTGIDNPSRVAIYLASTATTCFTCGSNLAQRGGSYLFLRYLYEQAELGNLGSGSGADLIKNMVQTPLTGVENIVAASLQSDDVHRFSELMERFATALYLSNTGITEDSRYYFSGINLRTLQEDNRGTYLDGPVFSTSSGTLVNSGIAYIDISGKTDPTPINLSEDASVGGILMQLE